MAGGLTRAWQCDQLIAAKLRGLPGFDVPKVSGQFECLAMLHLGQTLAFAVIQGRCPQRCVAVELVEQVLRILR
ncbi:hypothetical protein D3C84_343360 [compost metagenome]